MPGCATRKCLQRGFVTGSDALKPTFPPQHTEPTNTLLTMSHFAAREYDGSHGLSVYSPEDDGVLNTWWDSTEPVEARDQTNSSIDASVEDSLGVDEARRAASPTCTHLSSTPSGSASSCDGTDGTVPTRLSEAARAAVPQHKQQPPTPPKRRSASERETDKRCSASERETRSPAKRARHDAPHAAAAAVSRRLVLLPAPETETETEPGPGMPLLVRRTGYHQEGRQLPTPAMQALQECAQQAREAQVCDAYQMTARYDSRYVRMLERGSVVNFDHRCASLHSHGTYACSSHTYASSWCTNAACIVYMLPCAPHYVSLVRLESAHREVLIDQSTHSQSHSHSRTHAYVGVYWRPQVQVLQQMDTQTH